MSAHHTGVRRGRPRMTATDKIWNGIREALITSAMSSMSIPRAKDFSVRAAESIGGHIRELVEAEASRREREAYTRMRVKIEALIKEFDGGESNPNGGRNTEMTGHGALDFVYQAETELKSQGEQE